MGAQPSPDGDELRARAYLRALNVRPFGHQDPPMPEHDKRAVTPTRVIPAGAPLPARPPEPGEAPPWRTPPPPPRAAPADPPDPGTRTVVVRHVHEVVQPSPPQEEQRLRLWERLWDALVTWRMAIAILAALVPWVGGRSPVGIWAHALHQARTEAGIGAAYVIAIVAIAAAWALDRRTSRAIPRFLLVTALVGAVGVFDWFDPITLFTGVTR
ncbi:hypothetical protein [Streptomyces sp. NPDC047453]|uniref:hypothetical protein n=1 Tax=Streptomyces sp. NPDC047453 TaxID=3154812 RepID=UPI0033F2244C